MSAPDELATQLLNQIGAVSDQFASQRAARQQRRSLDPADFARLREAGYLLTGVLAEQGGLWRDVRQAVRPICGVLRRLARGDSSVALVASMHPAVLSYWLTTPEIDRDSQAEWFRQRQFVSQSALAGEWWGTITSEPASGGDIRRTQATARRSDDRYLLSGTKHFGSGWGVASYMVTSAIPEGEPTADWFFVDTRAVALGQPHPGATVIAEWDGHGMTATQSHAVSFRDFPAHRVAWPGGLMKIAAAAGGFINCLFTSVIVGVVDAAVLTARQQLVSRRDSLRPYEQVEWTRAEQEAWLIEQAWEGMVRAVETQSDPRRAALLGKTSIAELSETLLTRLCRVLGGGTYSRRSPFGFWLEDVRALGFLRPPWGLAYEQLGVLIGGS